MQISRRRFLAVSGVGTVLLARPAGYRSRGRYRSDDGSTQQPTAKIFTKTLRRNISVLEGSGGNIAVLSGRDGQACWLMRDLPSPGRPSQLL